MVSHHQDCTGLAEPKVTLSQPFLSVFPVPSTLLATVDSKMGKTLFLSSGQTILLEGSSDTATGESDGGSQGKPGWIIREQEHLSHWSLGAAHQDWSMC